MSRIFKAKSVQIDKNNRVVVDINNYNINKSEIDDRHSLKSKVNEYTCNSEENATKFAEEIIEKAKIQETEILNNANLEAEEIIKNTKLEAEKIYNERFQSGYDDGYKEGNKKAYDDTLEETTILKNEAKEIIKNAKQEKLEVLEKLEPEIVDLIYKITTDLVKTELKYDNSLILSLVKEGINSTTILEKLTIKLSSEDYETIIKEKEQLEKFIDSSKELKIIKDFTLKNNDCIIETDFGYVNCSIDDKLKTLKKNMELILKSR